MKAVPNGTLVSYKGTYADYHGPATVEASQTDIFGKSDDGYRYVLSAQDGAILQMVRSQSFALVSLP